MNRNIVQCIFDVCYDVKTFMAMRLVCKMWLEQSYKSQRYWYEWFLRHERWTWELKDHVKTRCKTFNNGHTCYEPSHFRVAVQVPCKLLKTVPLHLQVLSKVMRKTLRRESRELDKAQEYRDGALRTLDWYAMEIEQRKRNLEIADRLSEIHAVKRKRTRIEINISK